MSTAEPSRPWHDLVGVGGPSLPRVVRCRRHSDSGADVTVWVCNPPAGWSARCPCAVADRFAVATDRAPVWWTQCADVLLVSPQLDARVGAPAALGWAVDMAAGWLRQLPGCGLVAVPAGSGGTAIRTRTECAVLSRRAGCMRDDVVRVYAALVLGYRLGDLML